MSSSVLTPEMRINPFFVDLENRLEFMRHYEDKSLQQKALDSMPLVLLQEKAQLRLRKLQSQVKEGLIEDQNVSIQEMLLLELLAWFKSSFEWVDSPDCDKCGENTKFSHMSNDPKMLAVANRVEMHRCETCGQMTPFYRHTNPEKLLITREGRCGEWASCFTLYCRSLGWETRFVLDRTDHVWTEVYSVARNRWLHCDPCENVCDTPLIYENGWGKTLNYIIAFSHDDLQDVTWRYSSDHKKLLRNRTLCTENDLIKAIMLLRQNKQRNLSEARKKYLIKRCISELVELMFEKKPSDAEKEGRTSGSLAWRLERGETDSQNLSNNHIWTSTELERNNNQMIIRYSTKLNRYERFLHTNVWNSLENWENGVYFSKNIFRKEELDWKMAYICRKEGAEEGEIHWRFESDNNTVIDLIKIIFNRDIFENGQINLQLCGEDKCITIPTEDKIFSTNELSGNKSVTLKAVLTGGRGSCAWQHAQLFRVSTKNESMEYPFQVNVTFKKL